MLKFWMLVGLMLILAISESSFGEPRDWVAETLVFFFFLGGAIGNWGWLTTSVPADTRDIVTMVCSEPLILVCRKLFAFVLAITSGSCIGNTKNKDQNTKKKIKDNQISTYIRFTRRIFFDGAFDRSQHFITFISIETGWKYSITTQRNT